MSTEGSQESASRIEPTAQEMKPTVSALKKIGSAMFAAGDLLVALLPRTTVHWTAKDGKTDITETAIFDRLAVAAGMARATLVAARNTAAAFPPAVRLKSVDFSIYKALQSEAWKAGGARRPQIVEWIKAARKDGTLTVVTATEKARLLRLAHTSVTTSEGDTTSEGVAESEPESEGTNGHDLGAVALNPEQHVAGLNGFAQAFRLDPAAFQAWMDDGQIGRAFDIIAEAGGFIPTDAEMVEVGS